MTTRHQRAAAEAMTATLLEISELTHPEGTSERADMAAAELIASRRIIRLPGWRLWAELRDGQRWIHYGRRLSLIWSIEEHDGRLWLHVSLAGDGRTPRWDELVAAKEWVAGTDRYGYQVFPPRRLWVNQHPNALHVFCPWEGEPPLPEFSRGGHI